MQDDMRRAFKLFDIHGTGKIDVHTLRKIVRCVGLWYGGTPGGGAVALYCIGRRGV